MSAPARDSHSTAKPAAWQEAAPPAALLLALTVLFFWPQVVRGRVLYWGDIGLYFTPMLTFARENLRAGRLPLWNPLILCGTPYVGNPQTWLLYPLSALLPWLSAAKFISLTVAFHVWLAGLGTYLFARRALCVGRGPALLAAVTFMFGGQLVSKEQFPNMVQATAYLPWILWRLDLLLARQRGADALWLGVVLGLQLLAAHAQITLLTLYLGGAYAVWIQAQRPHRQGRAAWAAPGGRLARAGAIAVGLAAGQLLPATELFQHAWRQRLSFHVVNRFYLPFNQTANFVLPTLHGHPFRGDFTARGNFWETCCYVGALPFLAALWAAFHAWRRGGARAGRLWSGVFLVSLWMAWGGAGGLYRLAYWALPGFRSFHDPARCLVWAAFALAMLAAGGLEAVTHRLPVPLSPGAEALTPGPSPKSGRGGEELAAIAVALVAFADLMHFGRTLYPLANAGRLHPVTPAVAAVQSDPDVRAGQARFLAPDSARAWQRFTGHRAYRQDAPDYFALWTDTLTPNLMMSYGLRDAFGYEPVARRDAQTIAGTATQGFRPNAKPYERAAAATWAGFLGVRYVVSFRTRPPSRVIPGLAPVRDDPTLPPLPGKPGAGTRVFLSRNVRWAPRARLVTAFVAAPSAHAAQAVLTDALLHPAHLDLASAVVVAGRVPFASAAGPPEPATFERDEPDRVALSFTTTRPALLVLADAGHPGWRAALDGRPVAWLTADGFLRAVPVAVPGAHRVVFTYAPTSFRLGLYVSLVTLSGLAAARGSARTRARKKPRPPAGFDGRAGEIGAR